VLLVLNLHFLCAIIENKIENDVDFFVFVIFKKHVFHFYVKRSLIMKKKYIFMSVLTALSIIMCSSEFVLAETAEVYDADVDSIDEEHENFSFENGKNAFTGLFFGGGISTRLDNTEVKSVERFIECNSDIGQGQAGANWALVANAGHVENFRAADREVLRGRLAEYGIDRIDSMTGGTLAIPGVMGGVNITAFQASGDGTRKACSINSTKAGGAFILGYNASIDGNFVLGGGLAIDISSKKGKVCQDGLYGKNGIGDMKFTNGGFTPTFFVQLGVYNACIDGLFFVKFGAALQKFELKNNYNSLKFSKISPILGVGVQMKAVDGWNLRAEVDYSIMTKKEGILKGDNILINFDHAVGGVQRYGGAYDDTVTSLTQRTKAKAENKGLTVRICFVRNVNM
jgi:hypothetical protein